MKEERSQREKVKKDLENFIRPILNLQIFDQHVN
jgi:hypothetical protein